MALATFQLFNSRSVIARGHPISAEEDPISEKFSLGNTDPPCPFTAHGDVVSESTQFDVASYRNC